jgi:pimeloyl-ACP methyl ester carboxylesterase
MGTYVLIHGAWHGSWCWEKVAVRLRAAGHEVIAPDLPAQGADRTPPEQVSLEACVERVCEVASGRPGPVTWVAHSMGGVVATQAAERHPGLVQRLVYLCAFLPRSGESLMGLAQRIEDQRLAACIVPAGDGSLLDLDREAVRPLFYHDCNEDDVRRALALLRPVPVGPILTPVATSASRFGRIPRVYIECRKDAALPLPLQRDMVAALPCERVLSLETSHSPFLSAPDALVDHLLSL